MTNIFRKEIRRAINWLAVENKYLRDLESDLSKLRQCLSSIKHANTHQEMRRIFKDLDWVERSERRAENQNQRLEKDLKKLEEVMGVQGAKVKTLRERIRLAAEKVLMQTSYHENKMRGRLRSLKDNLNHERPLPEIHATINELLNIIKDIHAWLYPMTIDYAKLDELWIEFYKSHGEDFSDTVRIGNRMAADLGIPTPWSLRS